MGYKLPEGAHDKAGQLIAGLCKADRDTPEGNEQDRQEAEPKNAEGGA